VARQAPVTLSKTFPSSTISSTAGKLPNRMWKTGTSAPTP